MDKTYKLLGNVAIPNKKEERGFSRKEKLNFAHLTKLI